MSVLLRSKSQIYGLTAELAQIVNDAAAEATARADADTSLLNSIDGLGSTLSEIINGVNQAAAQKSANLSDLASVATARTNLDVFSKAETTSAINTALTNAGTWYEAADAAGMAALTGLTIGDMVHVVDAGDGKWAEYRVTVVNGSGSPTAQTLISDQDSLENSLTAASIKAAYESNADTNAFTDAEKDKLALVSATSAIDLDKVVQNDELLTSTTLAGATDTDIPSALAVKSYVDNAASSGGARFAAESLVVVSDKIMLANKPKDGMILNFGTVRHVDANGVAYDIPVVVDGTDATGKTYTLSPDSAGQFDTKSVQVQYPYVAA